MCCQRMRQLIVVVSCSKLCLSLKETPTPLLAEMPGKKSKSTSFKDKMIKGYAKDWVKVQEQIRDEAKEEWFD